MKSADAPERPKRGRPREFDRDTALGRAMLVFWARGYEGASINELTAAMGVNPPSLYAAFGNKERLFLEAVQRYSSGPGGIVPAVLAREATARGAIAQLLEEIATELSRSTHPPGCMVVTAAIAGSAAAASVQDALARQRAASETLIRARIQRGIDEGDVPVGTAAVVLAKFYMTVIQGMSVQARDGANRKRLRAIGALALRAWPERRARAVVSSRRGGRPSGSRRRACRRARCPTAPS